MSSKKYRSIIENFNKFIKENVDEIKTFFQNTDPDYLEKSLKQRNPGDESAGSTFLKPLSIEDIVGADWKPYKHPAISSPAIGFKASIPGTLGIAEIKNAPEEVFFQPAHGGKAMTKKPNPQTGKTEVLAEVVANLPEASRKVGHTTLIVGPSREDPKKLVVWTFFPGDPTPQLPEVTMREVKEKFKTTEDVIKGSKQDAIKLGYGFVKHANV